MRRGGFSLVELSIVLVILGLLTGGILAGQSLVRASQLRAVTTEYQNYISAVRSFQGKYLKIPGDMNNATTFWGDDAAACPDAAVADGTPGTCNGNADGSLDGAAAASVTGEDAQFWKQLALAGMIEGSYSGLAGAGSASGQHCAVGTDCPTSRFARNAGWGARGGGVSSGNAQQYALDYGRNYLVFGGAHSTALPVNKIMTPTEAWGIDTKLDDGKPARGFVIARYWNDDCGTPEDGVTFLSTNLDARYKLEADTNNCLLFFVRQF